jgi:MOSC domain-containing protein YiiM
MGTVLTVNLARPGPDRDAPPTLSGIHKVPTAEAVTVRAPGPMRGGLGSGLVGDVIGNHKVHGGDDQAVYAYAREDLDAWETLLQRMLTNGIFGENLTTVGVEVSEALIGERWQVGGDGLVLEVSAPRIPCRTFAAAMGERGWIKTFTRAAKPGAYLRVISPGSVVTGDAISVIHRPDHRVTVSMVFRAETLEPELLPHILAADALPEETKELARRRTD